MTSSIVHQSTQIKRAEYDLGCRIFAHGGTLAACESPEQRAGFIYAEALAEYADLQAMLAVSFSEWRVNPAVLEGAGWEL